MKLNKKTKLIIAFSTISLTDIILLLIIFFLLSSSFVTNTGIKVKLPKSSSAKNINKKFITVSINDRKEFFINGNIVSYNELEPLLSKQIQDKKISKILLKADKELKLDFIIQVIDIIKSAGAEDVIISTISKKNEV